jgi:transcriptional regulator with XRE-family HTH domain
MSQHNLKTFGRNIRMTRIMLGWNQTEFSRRAKVDRNTLGQIERGERKLIGVPYIIHIAKTLGVSPGELFKGCT